MKLIVISLVFLVLSTLLCSATWTGALSVDWNTPGNWSTGVVPNSAQPVYIVAGVANWPEVSTASASCANLNIASGCNLTISSTFSLHVYGVLASYGNLFITGSGDLLIDGYANWLNSSTVSVTNTNAQIIAYGNFTIANETSFNMSAGVLQLTGSNDTLFNNYGFFTTLANFWIAKTTGHSVEITSSTVYAFSVTTGIRVYAGSLLINNAPAQISLSGNLEDLNTSELYGLRFNAGTLRLYGGSQNIDVQGPGSYLWNLYRNGTPGLAATLYDNLTVKNNLYLYDGSILANGYNLNIGGSVNRFGGFLDITGATVRVGGDWSAEGGMVALTGSRVIFNGTGHQYCNYSTTFYILEVNKTGGAFRIDNPDATVNVYHYDWTAGAIDVLSGTINIGALDDGYIAGAWYLNSGGYINLNLAPEDYIDLGGDLHIFGGEFNVYGGGGTYPSYWPYNHNASVEMTGGLLWFRDQGVYISDDYAWSFSETISGGTIRVAQRFEVYHTGFTPTGGSIDLSGSTDAMVTHEAGSNLFNLYINKTAARETDNTQAWYRDRFGHQEQLLRTNTVTVQSALDINGFIWIQAGRLDLNQKSVDCAGHVYANGGVLEIDSGATLSMANGKAIAINDGARLEALGTSGSNAAITSLGYYYLGIWSGGTIAASDATFEKLQAEGVNVHAGASVDPVYSFHNCTFRYGISGGTLLTLNNSQNLLINGAIFPNNIWSGASNVTKSEDAGAANFANASGTFSGESYDNDNHERIIWTAPTSAYDLRIIKAKWSDPNPNLGGTVGLVVTYLNASSTPCDEEYVDMDWYADQDTPPILYDEGEDFQTLDTLPAGLPVDVTFSVTNTDHDHLGPWSSWLQIDTFNSVSESNEANNVYGPFYLTWNNLPPITDLSIQYTAGPGVRLDWTYPTAVYGFNIYRHTELFTEPDPA